MLRRLWGIMLSSVKFCVSFVSASCLVMLLVMSLWLCCGCVVVIEYILFCCGCYVFFGCLLFARGGARGEGLGGWRRGL